MTATTSLQQATRVDFFPVGAHLVTPRLGYTHHGIYVGDSQVIHYDGLSTSLRCGRVTQVSLAEFGNGRPVHQHDDAGAIYADLDVVARALSRLGENAYDVMRNNCEHFCAWCLCGVARSPQIERLLSGSLATVLATQLLTALLNVLSRSLRRA